MILFHLHFPAIPAFALLCSSCDDDVTARRRWQCASCSFALCTRCCQRTLSPTPYPQDNVPFNRSRGRPRRKRPAPQLFSVAPSVGELPDELKTEAHEHPLVKTEPSEGLAGLISR